MTITETVLKAGGIVPAFLMGLSLSLMAALPVNAIIIRHDTGYSEYHARESDFPGIFHLEASDRRHCIATLIAPSWAITAAHCLEETALQGHLDRGHPYPVEVAGQSVHITGAVRHQHYPAGPARGGPDVDLALLRLDRTLGVPRPVPLYRQSDEQGRVMTFLGWGFHALGDGGRFTNDGQFRRARNTVLHAGKRLRFRFDDPGSPDSQALPLEGLPGTGDSGGPALLRHDGRWYLAGVAVGELAREADDGSEMRQGLYGAEVLYERISLHQQWIDAVTGTSPLP